MLMWESALLGFFGGIVGVIFGVLGVKALQAAPSIRGLLAPDLNAGLMLLSVAAPFLYFRRKGWLR